MAGYVEEYPELKLFPPALKTVPHMIEGFEAAKTKLIDFVKDGKIQLRVRGKKLEEVMLSLAEAKEKTLALVRTHKVLESKGYRAMTKQRYMDTHQNRTPEEDGLQTVKKQRRGQSCDVVYVPKDHADEWDIAFQEEEAVEEREVYSRGQVCPEKYCTAVSERGDL